MRMTMKRSFSGNTKRHIFYDKQMESTSINQKVRKKKAIIISLKLLELSTKKKIFSLSKNTYLGETYLPTPPTELNNDVKNI